jgi:hypothetical protein
VSSGRWAGACPRAAVCAGCRVRACQSALCARKHAQRRSSFARARGRAGDSGDTSAATFEWRARGSSRSPVRRAGVASVLSGGFITDGQTVAGGLGGWCLERRRTRPGESGGVLSSGSVGREFRRTDLCRVRHRKRCLTAKPS